MFFIAGIQPKQTKIDAGSRALMCPLCGLYRAFQIRQDYYLSLFFIPLFPVKRGEVLLACDKCGIINKCSASSYGDKTEGCSSCGEIIDQKNYRFCPYCGKKL